jgi:hypothetical protein
VRAQRAQGEAQKVERIVSGLYGLGALALVLYFGQSDLMASVVGRPLEPRWPRLAGALAALWPALWLAAAAPIVLVEMAYASVARAPRLEIGRIHDALLSGLGLAGALVFAFTTAYVAVGRDHKVDLSYFRTAKPGESTHKIVAALDQPLEVALFFPPANEVREEVEGYFADLAHDSKMLQVAHYDHAIDPAKAKELGVSGNGIVVVKRGGRKELLSVGLELEAARSQLGNLDKEVQKRLLQVARPQRTVYFTSGHGERAFDPASDTDKRLTVRDLRELCQQQGYTVRTLGVAEGLAAEVPNDAAIVFVLGPEKAFLPEEAAAIARYLERGGRLLLALDPEAGLDGHELLAPLGLTFKPVTLANDQIYARRTYQASDRANIATGSYSSHPSVTSLGRLALRAPMILVGAGSLDEVPAKDKPKNLTVDFTVRAHPSTWNDLNGNYQFDAPAEARKGWPLAAAVLRKGPSPKDIPSDVRLGGKPVTEGSLDLRAIVLADSDAISDGIVGNPGNAYFVLDGTRWLLGDEGIAGTVSSEIDVPIAHTRKEDLVWFYSTIFVAPALAIGAGTLATRRRRRPRKAEVKS